MERLKEYNSQLEAVEQSLALTEEDSEKTSLINLREHLLELIDLTAISSKTEEGTPAEEFRSDDLTILGAHGEYNPESNLKSSLQLLREQLKLMVGEKCSAPHKHSWGSIVYHNAIICGIGEDVEMEGDLIANAHLRVLFTNPTHQEMLPCTYFLDGSCKFNAANCHYSHGELIPFDHLREYTEPNFEKLSSNCGVLAKMKDQLWHKGRVLNIDFVKHMCRVRLDGNQYQEKEVDFPFENLFPIFNDEDLSSESDIDSDSYADSTNESGTGKSYVEEGNLLAVTVHETLGRWEKHTRGIGSKLMAKMGYVQGNGLGCGGAGIVTPITARVYPQRCSLDHCMKLRETSEGIVDEVCAKKSRKMTQDATDTKLNGNASHHEDVFSFLNDTILKNAKEDSLPCSSKAADKSLQNQTTKTLNVESVRIADSIRKKQYEIIKVRESLRRSTKATDVHTHLLSQLNIKVNELNALRRREQLLTKEQKTRKDTEKLCIF